jgi:hypothetical protein
VFSAPDPYPQYGVDQDLHFRALLCHVVHAHKSGKVDIAQFSVLKVERKGGEKPKNWALASSAVHSPVAAIRLFPMCKLLKW